MNRGVCCFCEEDCNPLSQSCGRCVRNLTCYTLGWNNLFSTSKLKLNENISIIKDDRSANNLPRNKGEHNGSSQKNEKGGK